MNVKLTDNERTVLETVRDSPIPVGSWNMVDLLSRKGIEVSASTAGRMLNRLEKRGYLSKDNVNQGRRITAKGTAKLERIRQERSLAPLSRRLGEAINTNVLSRYLQVLEARKVIEGASVRLAAKNITAAELQKLKRIVAGRELSYRRGDTVMPHDLAFHSLIAEASRNEVLSLLYQTVAAQGQQSPRFEYIRKQVGGTHMDSHREIYDALRKRNAALAERLILRHLDILIGDVKRYWHRFLE